METLVEKRRHPRHEVLSAIMFMPNGDRHGANVLDISAGGARFDLPDDWVPRAGAALRIYFLVDTQHAVVLQGHVARVAIDHLGVQFDPAQEDSIGNLLGELRRAQTGP